MNAILRTTLLPFLLLAVGPACGSAGGTARTATLPEAPGDGGPVDPDRVYPPAGTAWVIFGADTAVAEVALTPEERQDGLMYRESLGENAGMLFVFDRPEVHSFWMQNTYIPLDIAYLDTNMAIINILAMEPLGTDLYESEGPAMFALEMNQGWFAARSIRPGDRANIVYGR